MTLIRLSIAWMVGLSVATWLHPPALPLLAGLVACATALAACRARAHQRTACAAAACALLGALRVLAAEPAIDADHIAQLNERDAVAFRGRIDAEPRVRDRGTEYRVSADAVRDGETWRRAHGIVLVQAPRYPAHAYGETVTVTARLETPPVLDTFDYRAWLARQGVHSLARRPRIETIARGGGNSVRRGLLAVKDAARRAIAASLPEPEAALATGILLGDDEGMPEALVEAFRTTNTTHVIAISGSNIALLIAILSATLGRVLGRRQAVPAVIVTLVLYTALVGADPAVVRAAVMGSITVLGVMLGQPAHAATSLLAAAWAMTAYCPGYLTDLGFQLSFAATAGLIVLGSRLTSGAETVLTATVGSGRARAATALAGEAVLVTLAAQAATWPLIAWQTGSVSVVGLVANFAIVPAQPAVMVLGGLAAVAGMAWDDLGRLAGVVAWLPVAYTIRVVEIAARAPMAAVTWQMPLAAVVAWYAGLAAVAHPRRAAAVSRLAAIARRARAIAIAGRRRAGASLGPASAATSWPEPAPAAQPSPDAGPRGAASAPRIPPRAVRLALPILAVACVLVWVAALARPDGYLHLYVLDVGQGDALLIVTPNGRRMLVDGGPGPNATLAGLGRHLAPWDRRIDAIVLTHPDSDHVGGLAAVADRYEVGLVVAPAVEAGAPEAAGWQAALSEHGIAPVAANAGQRLVLDQAAGVIATVLWPEAAPAGRPAAVDPAGDSVNNHSVVLRVVHGDVALLLTGDIETPIETRLVASRAPLDADVLKVAHHGSDTSSTADFLAAVTPGLALISVGAGNRFGHPSPEVTDRLARCTVRRTDRHGAIEVATDGHAVWWR